MFDHALRQIDGLTDDDLAKLRNQHMEYAEEFWAKMAENSTLIDSLGLSDDAKKRVVEAMSRFAKERANSITQNRVIVHLPDMIVALALFFLVYSLFFSDRDMARQVVVIAAKGLEPFHVISKSDVEIRDSIKNASALGTVDRVVGKYTTEQIPQGTIIEESKLNSGPRLSNELDGLRIYELELQPSAILTDLKPPVKLGLIASGHDKVSENKIYDVYILDVRRRSDGVSAVVASTEPDCQALTSFQGRGYLIPIGPAH